MPSGNLQGVPGCFLSLFLSEKNNVVVSMLPLEYYINTKKFTDEMENISYLKTNTYRQTVRQTPNCSLQSP